MADGREPFGLAMVICDAIHRDPATGKRTLLGLFSAFRAPSFPFTVRVMAIHLAFTEVLGKIQATLRIVDANEERPPVVEAKGDIEGSDPLAVIEADFVFGNVVFPEPGEYRVQFYAGDTPVCERRLMVVPPPQAGE